MTLGCRNHRYLSSHWGSLTYLIWLNKKAIRLISLRGEYFHNPEEMKKNWQLSLTWWHIYVKCSCLMQGNGNVMKMMSLVSLKTVSVAVLNHLVILQQWWYFCHCVSYVVVIFISKVMKLSMALSVDLPFCFSIFNLISATSMLRQLIYHNGHVASLNKSKSQTVNCHFEKLWSFTYFPCSF